MPTNEGLISSWQSISRGSIIFRFMPFLVSSVSLKDGLSAVGIHKSPELLRNVARGSLAASEATTASPACMKGKESTVHSDRSDSEVCQDTRLLG